MSQHPSTLITKYPLRCTSIPINVLQYLPRFPNPFQHSSTPPNIPQPLSTFLNRTGSLLTLFNPFKLKHQTLNISYPLSTFLPPTSTRHNMVLYYCYFYWCITEITRMSVMITCTYTKARSMVLLSILGLYSGALETIDTVETMRHLDIDSVPVKGNLST